ncbi:hypothetical protein JCM10213_002983 [Rhodosporidiobolus nylandii]
MDDIPVLSTFTLPATPAPSAPPWPEASAALPQAAPPHPSSAALRALKMKSCAVCRLRRVKCERDPGQTDCRGCLARGLVCAPPPEKEKGGLRNGKRVKAANASSAASASPPATSVLSDSLELTSSSANARLGAIELQSATMSNFLESFLAFKSVTTFDGDINFRLTFDQAGRRFSQLHPANQVLCCALLALGARCSAHPSLVGSGAPRIEDLAQATLNDVDLRSFGGMRRQATEALTRQAFEVADEKGALRMESRESVAALMMLESLLEISDSAFRTGNGYGAAYKSQIRMLLAASVHDPSKRAIQGSVMGWTAYVRDSLTSAFTGMSPTFSSDDAWLLRGEEDPPPPLPERLLQPPPPQPEVAYWSLLDSYIHWVTDLARTTASNLTGPRARKRPLDVEFAREAVRKLRLAIDAVPELLGRAKSFPGSPKFTSDAAALVRTMRLSTCQFSWIIHRIICERITARSGGTILSVDAVSAGLSSLDDENWTRLGQLKREVDGLVFKAAREIVATLAETLSAGIPLGTHQWLDSRSTELLFTRLPVWAIAILDMPVAGEGGPPEFTLEAKISDLRWILRALRSVGWAAERLAASYGWVEHELAKLESRQPAIGAHLPSFSYPPSHAHPDTSPSFPSFTDASAPPFTTFSPSLPGTDEVDLDALLAFTQPFPPPSPANAALPPEAFLSVPFDPSTLDTLLGSLAENVADPLTALSAPSSAAGPVQVSADHSQVAAGHEELGARVSLAAPSEADTRNVHF